MWIKEFVLQLLYFLQRSLEDLKKTYNVYETIKMCDTSLMIVLVHLIGEDHSITAIIQFIFVVGFPILKFNIFKVICSLLLHVGLSLT